MESNLSNSLLRDLSSIISPLDRLCIEFRSSEVQTVDADALRKIPTQHLELAFNLDQHNCYVSLVHAISPDLKRLDLSCFSLTSDNFKCEENYSLTTLTLCSCEISDAACTSLVHFLQSSYCVLENVELNTIHANSSSHYPYPRNTCIPNELIKAIVSKCSLRHFVLKGVDISVLEHLVTGLKNNSSLVELTVSCTYSTKDDHHYSELIRVINEQNTSMTRLKLNYWFEGFVQKFKIRDNLKIEYL